MNKNQIYVLGALIAGATLAGCSFGGFKPTRNAIGDWDLTEESRVQLSKDKENAYIYKLLDDFKECGIDPMFGTRTGKNTEAEGYLCIESRGWYRSQGPMCVQWLLFEDPTCVAWRKERGLEYMPMPQGPHR